MVLLEFSMTPSTQGESKSRHVARILDIIDRSGLPYQLTPMGTIIEGEWAEVMAVVKADAYGHGSVQVAEKLQSLVMTRGRTAVGNRPFEQVGLDKLVAQARFQSI